MACQKYDGDMRLAPEKLALQLQTAQARQLHIENEAARCLAKSARQEIVGGAIGLHSQSLRTQQSPDGLPDGDIIINYTDESVDVLHDTYRVRLIVVAFD
jgi:hypothetical protein